MQNLIFLFPLYNDWDSLNKLLEKINNKLDEINSTCRIIVVDDNSTISPIISINELRNIKELKVLKLKKILEVRKPYI